MSELTHNQKAAHFETWEHIHEVQKLLYRVQMEIARRSLSHDQSKMLFPEAETFAEYTPKLKNTEYGSDEYRQCMREMGPAIKHHQKNNLHHPECHINGIDGMDLVDLLEMLCDWKAATLRTKNGDIHRSLEIQHKRFVISNQLMQILKNTIQLIE